MNFPWQLYDEKSIWIVRTECGSIELWIVSEDQIVYKQINSMLEYCIQFQADS